jgi:hypothetical protein
VSEFKHSAADVYVGSNGDVTKAFYAELEKRGPLGIVAMNLFRAQKCSARAKLYQRRAHKGEAYNRKNWSMGLLCEALERYEVSRSIAEHGKHEVNIGKLSIRYGWQQDPDTPGFEWVLYVDLPQGQVSFHAATRGAGPDYQGEWCGDHLSAERIVEFCDAVMSGQTSTRRHGDGESGRAAAAGAGSVRGNENGGAGDGRSGHHSGNPALQESNGSVRKVAPARSPNRKAQALASQAALFTDASKGEPA